MTLRRGIALALIALLAAAIGAGVLAARSAQVSAYAVRTGSMVPTYDPGDLVVDEPAPASSLRVGEVITFHHGPELVTHRIHDLTHRDGHLVIHTKGDANRTEDTWDLAPAEVVGHVVSGVPNGGYAVVFLEQPAGVAGVMLAGMSLVLLHGLFFGSGPGAGAGRAQQESGPESSRSSASVSTAAPVPGRS